MNYPDITTFRPDYAVHPGMLLEQELEHRRLSQADFARRIARTPKLVSEIISGKNPVEPETAIQFERVLGIGADIWLRMEAQFRLHKARFAEKQELSAYEQWLKDFPVKELMNRHVIRKAGTTAEKTLDLLTFFGVASHAAFNQRYENVAVHYRRSMAMQASRTCLLTWLRLGEIKASQESVAAYNKAQFRGVLMEIRKLTNERIEQFLPKMKALCAQSGVVFVLIPPLPKTCLSGAAYWSQDTTPVLQQSLRHKTNDHFWFTFFHEAAHILLHSSKALYADDETGKADGVEEEANNFATEVLVGRKTFTAFLTENPRSKEAVKEFAAQKEIHPGIVVGMLQHHGIIPWSHLNYLKTRFSWTQPNRGHE
jgi:addiction module HigA family antidote